jgi:hypothetical protein
MEERSTTQVTYKGKPIRTTTDFSTEIQQASRSWSDVLSPDSK